MGPYFHKRKLSMSKEWRIGVVDGDYCIFDGEIGYKVGKDSTAAMSILNGLVHNPNSDLRMNEGRLQIRNGLSFWSDALPSGVTIDLTGKPATWIKRPNDPVNEIKDIGLLMETFLADIRHLLGDKLSSLSRNEAYLLMDVHYCVCDMLDEVKNKSD